MREIEESWIGCRENIFKRDVAGNPVMRLSKARLKTEMKKKSGNHQFQVQVPVHFPYVT
jgi:hypothetical protein